METSETVLEGRGVGHIFGRDQLAVRALYPADLKLGRGELAAIMGPSGSGKTTLLCILGLVLEPAEGSVWIEGKQVSGRRPDEAARLRRDRIGFVFQQFQLLRGLTVEENVALPLVLKKTPEGERRERIRAALAEVGMLHRREFKPRQLSGGEQQRAAIARALITEAPVILCDEPTASLDRERGDAVLALLRRLADQDRRAVAIVSHDPRIRAVADRVVEIHDGRITADA